MSQEVSILHPPGQRAPHVLDARAVIAWALNRPTATAWCPTCNGQRGRRPGRLCKSCRAYCTPRGAYSRIRFCDVAERFTNERCGCLTHWRACSCAPARETGSRVVSLLRRLGGVQ